MNLKTFYFSHLFKNSYWIPIICKAPYIILVGRNNGLYVFETYNICGRKIAKWVKQKRCAIYNNSMFEMVSIEPRVCVCGIDKTEMPSLVHFSEKKMCTHLS